MLFMRLHTLLYKKLFLALLCLATGLSLQAQVGNQRNDWAVGGNVGISLNKVLFTPTIRQNYLPGIVAGVTARHTGEIYYGMICAVQMEANIWTAGWKEDIYSNTGDKLPDTYSRSITYLQIPFLAHLGLGHEHNGVKGFLLLGPQISYAFSDKETRSKVWTTTEENSVPVPNRANGVVAQYRKKLDHRLEYGITAGLGAELSTPIGHFIIDARYYYGLSDIFGNAKKDPFSRSANNAIMIKTSYLFDLPKKKH